MLETEIKKLTAAIEANTAALNIVSGNATTPAPDPAPAPPAQQEAAPAPPAQEAPAASAETVPVMTMDELNKALGEQFARLGNDRGPIDKALKEFGVDSIANLPAESYRLLLAKVEAVNA